MDNWCLQCGMPCKEMECSLCMSEIDSGYDGYYRDPRETFRADLDEDAYLETCIDRLDCEEAYYVEFLMVQASEQLMALRVPSPV